MSEDYNADVKRYKPDANAKAVAGIVKHLGIALKSKDASLVSCSSKEELARVRDSWLKKKLALKLKLTTKLVWKKQLAGRKKI